MFASDLKKIKWEDLYHLPSCEEQLQMFTSNINELMDKHFPTKTVVRYTTDKPWVTDRFRDLIRRRQHAWKAGDQALYHLYRNKVNRLSKSLKKNYYDKRINGLKTSNPRNWWKGMKELLGCQQTSSDPPLLHLANQVCDGNLLELSQRINNFFKSVSDHLPALSADNDYLQLEIPCVPSKYVIPVEKVEKQLRKLDTSKAPGLYQAGSLKCSLNCLPAQLPQSTTAHFERGMFHVSGVLHTSAPFRKRNRQNISKRTLDQYL